MMRQGFIWAAVAAAAFAAFAAEPARPAADQGRAIDALPAVLPQRARVDAVNRMLRDRLDTVLPSAMREAGIDMWLVINREYAEDPVYLTLVPEPSFAARRTTMLVFFDRGPAAGVERLTVSRYGLGDVYKSAWEGGTDEEQWTRLAAVIAERNPKKIGINVSRHWAFGDGLSKGLHEQLVEALPADLASRLVSAENLALRWLETRTALELEAYPQIVALARAVLAEAFSNRVITPGVTTTDDVAWYIRQRYDDLGLPIWFMPYVNIQRRGDATTKDDPFFGKEG
ncbi:MAG TPA: Xaa-Pro aminopeptidase, partial [Thermoanaerobaculia bacterium]